MIISNIVDILFLLRWCTPFFFHTTEKNRSSYMQNICHFGDEKDILMERLKVELHGDAVLRDRGDELDGH